MSETGKTEMVRRELVRLRARTGIRQQRITECPTICALAAVRDEAERREIEPQVAAFDVICCAIDRIKRADMRLILGYTLNANVSQDYGDLLEDRREVLFRTIVPLSSTSQRKAREEEAYRELASILVRAEESPCTWGRPDLDEPGYLAQPPRELDPRPIDERSDVDSVTIAFNISIELSNEVAGELAIRLLDLLPGLGIPETDDHVVARRRLEELLRHTERLSFEMSSRFKSLPAEAPSPQYVGPHILTAVDAMRGGGAALVRSLTEKSYTSQKALDNHLTSRNAAVLHVAHFWREVERANMWRIYLPFSDLID